MLQVWLQAKLTGIAPGIVWQVKTRLRSLRDGGPRVRPVVSQVLLVFWDFFPKAFRLVPGLNRYWRDWSAGRTGRVVSPSVAGASSSVQCLPLAYTARRASQSVGEGYRLPRAANDVYLWAPDLKPAKPDLGTGSGTERRRISPACPSLSSVDATVLLQPLLQPLLRRPAVAGVSRCPRTTSCAEAWTA